MTSTILVIGGGFSGITAALEAAELGHEVFLVEKNPFLGGRVAQLNKYFPKLCPPSCGLEIQFQRIKKNQNITCFTLAEVVSLSGETGNFTARINIKPRFTAPQSIDFSKLAQKLSAQTVSDFNFGLNKRKPLYMDMPFAFPHRYVLQADELNETDLQKIKQNPFIDLTEQEKTIELQVGSVIYATGWKPYDVTKLTNLGAGQIPDCISNMQMERLAAAGGPTNGEIICPSSGRRPHRIAFVQCAGSRDENHLPYCSYICCMASLKQANYLRTQNTDCEISIFYIDLRTPGRYENFAQKILADEKIHAIKGKVAELNAGNGGQGVWVTVENILGGGKSTEYFDMVVLATGMQPNLVNTALPSGIKLDDNGFIIDSEQNGIFAAGCAAKPLDVMKSAQSATCSAMKAIQTVRGK